MPSKFHAAVHQRDDITYLKLAGVIDEDNELGPLGEQISQLKAGTVVLDVGEIERINSCGVRDWVNWLGRVEKVGHKILLVECSPSMVAQVNLVNNFTGNGAVKSFYAPYFCPSCDREKLLLIETRDAIGVNPFRAPTCRCDECDGPMDFDDMEESYFAFLQHTSKIVADARVDRVITEFTPSDSGPKLRTRSGPGGATLTPTPAGTVSSLPSVPSLPSMRKLADNYAQASSGRHVQPTPAAQTVQGEKTASDRALAGRESSAEAARTMVLAAPAQFVPVANRAHPSASNRLWLALMGALVIAALAVGWLIVRA